MELPDIPRGYEFRYAAFALSDGDPLKAREIYRTMSYAEAVEAGVYGNYRAMVQEILTKRP